MGAIQELFPTEYKAAEEMLNSKGYLVCNMVYDKERFELSKLDDDNGKVLIDNLSLSQLQQLAEML